jgi:hypothetical protein
MASLALAVAVAEFFDFANLELDCIGSHCSICLQAGLVQRLLECLVGVCIIAALYAQTLLKLIACYFTPFSPEAL